MAEINVERGDFGDLPPWARSLMEVLGMDWPDVNQYMYRGLAGNYYQVSAQLKELRAKIQQVEREIYQHFSMNAAEGFRSSMRDLSGPGVVDDLTKAVADVANGLHEVALKVEYAKFSALGQLFMLAWEIALEYALASVTGGMSLANLTWHYAATRQYLGALFRIMVRAIAFEMVIGVTGGMITDAVVQRLQRERAMWDHEASKQTLYSGLIGGLFGGTIGELGEHLGRKLGGVLGKDFSKFATADLLKNVKNFKLPQGVADDIADTWLRDMGRTLTGRAGLQVTDPAQAFTKQLTQRFAKDVADKFDDAFGHVLGKDVARQLGDDYARAFVDNWTRHGMSTPDMFKDSLRSVLDPHADKIGKGVVDTLTGEVPDALTRNVTDRLGGNLVAKSVAFSTTFLFEGLSGLPTQAIMAGMNGQEATGEEYAMGFVSGVIGGAVSEKLENVGMKGLDSAVNSIKDKLGTMFGGHGAPEFNVPTGVAILPVASSDTATSPVFSDLVAPPAYSPVGTVVKPAADGKVPSESRVSGDEKSTSDSKIAPSADHKSSSDTKTALADAKSTSDSKTGAPTKSTEAPKTVGGRTTPESKPATEAAPSAVKTVSSAQPTTAADRPKTADTTATAGGSVSETVPSPETVGTVSDDGELQYLNVDGGSDEYAPSPASVLTTSSETELGLATQQDSFVREEDAVQSSVTTAVRQDDLRAGDSEADESELQYLDVGPVRRTDVPHASKPVLEQLHDDLIQALPGVNPEKLAEIENAAADVLARISPSTSLRGRVFTVSTSRGSRQIEVRPSGTTEPETISKAKQELTFTVAVRDQKATTLRPDSLRPVQVMSSQPDKAPAHSATTAHEDEDVAAAAQAKESGEQPIEEHADGRLLTADESRKATVEELATQTVFDALVREKTTASENVYASVALEGNRGIRLDDPSLAGVVGRMPTDGRFFTFLAHGDERGAPVVGGRSLTSRQVADMLLQAKRDGLWDGVKPLMFASCGTGRGGARSFAAEVLVELGRQGIEVGAVAPTGPVFFVPNVAVPDGPGHLVVAAGVGLDVNLRPVVQVGGGWVHIEAGTGRQALLDAHIVVDQDQQLRDQPAPPNYGTGDAVTELPGAVRLAASAEQGALYRDAGYSAEVDRFESKLGAHFFNDDAATDQLRGTVERLMATMRSAGTEQDLYVSMITGDPAVVGQPDPSLDEREARLLVEGNARELSALLLNLAAGSGPVSLSGLVDDIVARGDWVRAGELGLDMAALQAQAYHRGQDFRDVLEVVKDFAPADVVPAAGIDDDSFEAEHFHSRARRIAEVVGRQLTRVDGWRDDVAVFVQDLWSTEELTTARPGVEPVSAADLDDRGVHASVAEEFALYDGAVRWVSRSAKVELDRDSIRYRDASARGIVLKGGAAVRVAEAMWVFQLVSGDGNARDFLHGLLGSLLPTNEYSLHEVLAAARVSGCFPELERLLKKDAAMLYRDLPGLGAAERRGLGLLPHEALYMVKAEAKLGSTVGHLSEVDDDALGFTKAVLAEVETGSRLRKPLKGTVLGDWLLRHDLTARDLLDRLSPAHFLALAVYTGPTFPLMNAVLRVPIGHQMALTKQLSSTVRKVPPKLWPLFLRNEPEVVKFINDYVVLEPDMDEYAELVSMAERHAKTHVEALTQEMFLHNHMLMDALRQLPTALGEVWRGDASTGDTGTWLGRLISPVLGRDGITFNEFTSTAREKDIALEFAAGRKSGPLVHPVLLQLQLTGGSGYDIKPFSRYAHEDEILLAPGAQIRVGSRVKVVHELTVDDKVTRHQVQQLVAVETGPSLPYPPGSSEVRRRQARARVLAKLTKLADGVPVREASDLVSLAASIGIKETDVHSALIGGITGEADQLSVGEQVWGLALLHDLVFGEDDDITVDRLRAMHAVVGLELPAGVRAVDLPAALHGLNQLARRIRPGAPAVSADQTTGPRRLVEMAATLLADGQTVSEAALRRGVFSSPGYFAKAEQFESGLGAFAFNDPRSLAAARAAVDRLLTVLRAAHPDVDEQRIHTAFGSADPTSAGQVGLAAFEVVRTRGSVRELMTAFYNAAYRVDSPFGLKALLNDIVRTEDWQRASALGLDVGALRAQADYLNSTPRKLLHRVLARVAPGSATMFEHDAFATGNVLAQSPFWARLGAEYLASIKARRARPAESGLHHTPAHFRHSNTGLSDRERAFLRENPVALELVGFGVEEVPLADLPRDEHGELDVDVLRSRPNVTDVEVRRDEDGTVLRVLAITRQPVRIDDPRAGDLEPGRQGPELPLSWRSGEQLFRLDTSSSWYRDAHGRGMPLVAGVSATSAKMMNALRLLNLPKVPAEDFTLALFGWMLPSRDHSAYEILSGAGMVTSLSGVDLTDAVSMYSTLPGIDPAVARSEFGVAGMLPHEAESAEQQGVPNPVEPLTVVSSDGNVQVVTPSGLVVPPQEVSRLRDQGEQQEELLGDLPNVQELLDEAFNIMAAEIEVPKPDDWPRTQQDLAYADLFESVMWIVAGKLHTAASTPAWVDAWNYVLQTADRLRGIPEPGVTEPDVTGLTITEQANTEHDIAGQDLNAALARPSASRLAEAILDVAVIGNDGSGVWLPNPASDATTLELQQQAIERLQRDRVFFTVAVHVGSSGQPEFLGEPVTSEVMTELLARLHASGAWTVTKPLRFVACDLSTSEEGRYVPNVLEALHRRGVGVAHAFAADTAVWTVPVDPARIGGPTSVVAARQVGYLSDGTPAVVKGGQWLQYSVDESGRVGEPVYHYAYMVVDDSGADFKKWPPGYRPIEKNDDLIERFMPGTMPFGLHQVRPGGKVVAMTQVQFASGEVVADLDVVLSPLVARAVELHGKGTDVEVRIEGRRGNNLVRSRAEQRGNERVKAVVEYLRAALEAGLGGESMTVGGLEVSGPGRRVLERRGTREFKTRRTVDVSIVDHGALSGAARSITVSVVDNTSSVATEAAPSLDKVTELADSVLAVAEPFEQNTGIWLVDPADEVQAMARQRKAMSNLEGSRRFFTVAVNATSNGVLPFAGTSITAKVMTALLTRLYDRGVWSPDRPLRFASSGLGTGDSAGFVPAVLRGLHAARGIKAEAYAADSSVWSVPDRKKPSVTSALVVASRVGSMANGAHAATGDGSWLHFKFGASGDVAAPTRHGAHVSAGSGSPIFSELANIYVLARPRAGLIKKSIPEAVPFSTPVQSATTTEVGASSWSGESEPSIAELLSDIDRVVVAVGNAKNFGHQAAATTLVKSLRDSGFRNKVTFVADAESARKLQLLITDDLEPVEVRSPGQHTSCNGRTLLLSAGDDAIRKGDTDGALAFLDRFGADEAIILKPYAWEVSSRLHLKRDPGSDDGVRIVDLDRYISKEARYVYEVPRFDDAESLMAFIDEQIPGHEKAPGLKAVVEAVLGDQQVDLMPIYGLLELADFMRPGVSAHLAEAVHSLGGKPAIMLEISSSSVPYIPEHKADWLKRADITAPDVAQQISSLADGDVLILRTGSLPQAVFQQMFQLGELPAITEGANSTNLVHLIGRPNVSLTEKNTPYPPDQDESTRARLRRVSVSLVRGTPWTVEATGDPNSEYITPDGGIDLLRASAAGRALETLNALLAYVRAPDTDPEVPTSEVVQIADLMGQVMRGQGELVAEVLSGNERAHDVARVVDAPMLRLEYVTTKVDRADLFLTEGELLGLIGLVESQQQQLSNVLHNLGVDNAPLQENVRVVEDALRDIADEKSDMRAYFTRVHRASLSLENDQVMQALLYLKNDGYATAELSPVEEIETPPRTATPDGAGSAHTGTDSVVVSPGAGSAVVEEESDGEWADFGGGLFGDVSSLDVSPGAVSPGAGSAVVEEESDGEWADFGGGLFGDVSSLDVSLSKGLLEVEALNGAGDDHGVFAQKQHEAQVTVSPTDLWRTEQPSRGLGVPQVEVDVNLDVAAARPSASRLADAILDVAMIANDGSGVWLPNPATDATTLELQQKAIERLQRDEKFFTVAMHVELSGLPEFFGEPVTSEVMTELLARLRASGSWTGKTLRFVACDLGSSDMGRYVPNVLEALYGRGIDTDAFAADAAVWPVPVDPTLADGPNTVVVAAQVGYLSDGTPAVVKGGRWLYYKRDESGRVGEPAYHDAHMIIDNNGVSFEEWPPGYQPIEKADDPIERFMPGTMPFGPAFAVGIDGLGDLLTSRNGLAKLEMGHGTVYRLDVQNRVVVFRDGTKPSTMPRDEFVAGVNDVVEGYQRGVQSAVEPKLFGGPLVDSADVLTVALGGHLFRVATVDLYEMAMQAGFPPDPGRREELGLAAWHLVELLAELGSDMMPGQKFAMRVLTDLARANDGVADGGVVTSEQVRGVLRGLRFGQDEETVRTAWLLSEVVDGADSAVTPAHLGEIWKLADRVRATDGIGQTFVTFDEIKETVRRIRLAGQETAESTVEDGDARIEPSPVLELNSSNVDSAAFRPGDDIVSVPQPIIITDYEVATSEGVPAFESYPELKVSDSATFPVMPISRLESAGKPPLNIAADGTLGLNGTSPFPAVGRPTTEAKEFYASPDVIAKSQVALRKVGSGITLKIVPDTTVTVNRNGSPVTLQKVTAVFKEAVPDACRDTATVGLGGMPETAIFRDLSGNAQIADIDANDGLEVTGLNELASNIADSVNLGVDLGAIDPRWAAGQIKKDPRSIGGLSKGGKMPGAEYGPLLNFDPANDVKRAKADQIAQQIGINQYALAKPGEGYVAAAVPTADDDGNPDLRTDFANSGDLSGLLGYHFATVVAESTDGKSQVLLENYARRGFIRREVDAAIDMNLRKFAGQFDRAIDDAGTELDVAKDTGDPTAIKSAQTRLDLARALMSLEQAKNDGVDTASADLTVRNAMLKHGLATGLVPRSTELWHFKMYSKQPGSTFFDHMRRFSIANPIVVPISGGHGSVEPQDFMFSEKDKAFPAGEEMKLNAIAKRIAKGALFNADNNLPAPSVAVTGFGNGKVFGLTGAEATSRARADATAEALKDAIDAQLKKMQGDTTVVTADDISINIVMKGRDLDSGPLSPGLTLDQARRRTVIEIDLGVDAQPGSFAPRLAT
ncbi:hypothetical protein [Lentzea jiangxiensis]|uniref:Outer membrane channel protein CpnT-like N-terminal domain-containing protein n=1 Tax=Lentzea jiangxiensis TaxID=641025 RepID=A0A1H0X3A3_9PSEU|nr:hypothetical protein [Lentzea jiangxiensis]SDP97438.1 hypothetical protein SAMN05421507_13115 [Lentzea jiangxiensis]